MSLDVGDDFSWFKPVDLSGETIGSYIGDHEALNLSGAQPGFHYYYQRNKTDAIIRYLNKGWSVVGPDDPEKFGSGRVSWKVQTTLGTDRAYQDVVLMKIPLELYRQQQETLKELNESAINDHGPRFTELGAERAQQLRSKPKGMLYYMGRDHGQTIEEF
jgi:hypothetical protein